MKVIFKIEEHLPDTKQIVVRFAKSSSLKYIEEYRKLAIDYDVLDLYDTETFIKSMMRKYGDARIQSIENEKGINKSEVVEGKLDIQSLVGKVIECNTDGYRREVIKMRRVEL